MSFEEHLQRRISRITGTPESDLRLEPAGGGCIHSAAVARLADGRSFFVKSNDRAKAGMFLREAQGLEALGQAGRLRVPQVLEAADAAQGRPSYILMEYIQPGRPKGGFMSGFGRALARMHLETQAERFGFEGDNYLGSTPQPNGWSPDWVEFWRERRLGFQVGLARSNGLTDRRMDRFADRLLDRLEGLIGHSEPPQLIHGDLWSGNYLCDSNGQPVLIDPAVYYGQGEAELAMCRLFGGFGAGFYRAYQEVHPFPPGAEARLDIYQLYHLLNHLNLFGAGYRSSCLSILRRYGG